MTKKAEVLIKLNGSEVDAFYSKTLTKRLNKLPKGTVVELFIKEDGYGEQYVGTYEVKGLDNEPDEPPVHSCAPGTHWDEAAGKCVADVQDCPEGKHWDEDLKTCVDDVGPEPECPPGQHFDPPLGRCVDDVVTPPPQPSGDRIEPKYQALAGGKSYVMPKSGAINDGVRIDKGASKWGLNRQSDGSILVDGSTIRLKVWATKYMTDSEIFSMVEATNPKWEYNKAREIGYWGSADKCWTPNTELTAIVEFQKVSRPDPFVGIVMHSCIHDNASDPELKGRSDACHAGSSVHSNIQGNGGLEEKIEFLHVDYGNYSKTIPSSLPKLGDIHNKKVGFKVCCFNTKENGKDIVKVETYVDKDNGGLGPYKLQWTGIHDGSEDSKAGLMNWGSAYIILKSNDTKYKLHDLQIVDIVPPS